jgi:hypothetical protein
MTDPYLPDQDTPPDEPSPWGFRIVLILVALYLLWRLIQGMVWVWHAMIG